MALTKVSSAMKTAPTSAEVTAHADTDPIRNDIATLALHSAIADNKAAYNLSNSFIDQFEDSTGIDTTSTASRTSDEYMMAGSSTTETFGYNDSLTITYTVAGTGVFESGGQAKMEDNDTDAYAAYGDASSSNAMFRFDFGESVELSEAQFYSFSTHARFATGYFEWSDTDGGTYTAVTPLTVTNSSDSFSGTDMTFANTEAWHGCTFTGITKRYWQWRMTSVNNNGNNYAGIAEVKWPGGKSTSISASGNYTSTTQASTASVSEMGIVVLYKNNEGTATLNTDLVAQVSANGGTNYSSATLVAGGTFSSGINIAAVSGVSVTAGTAPKYKISFANQASASKETQVHGVALLY